MSQCKICEKPFSGDAGLHRHIPSHDITLEGYYHTYYPRYDKWTGKLIEYKNKAKYLEADFNDYKDQTRWLTCKASKGEAKEYLTKKLKEGALDKPKVLTEAAMLTKKLPSLVFYVEHMEEEYRKIIAEKQDGLERKKEIKKRDLGPMKIFVDTREQKPFSFDVQEPMKLSFGDYTVAAPYYSNVFVERKSLNDLINTMSSGHKRFENEIKRAALMDSYLVVLVEAPISHLVDYKANSGYSQKVNGGFITKRVRDFYQNFHNIQFLFVRDRIDAMRATNFIFKIGEEAKTCDLQFYYNYKLWLGLKDTILKS